MKYLLLIILLISYPTAKGQNGFWWADSSSVWHVMEASFALNGNTTITTKTFSAAADSLIGQYGYQRITDGSGVAAFLRKDSTGRVFRLSATPGQPELLIYNFGAQPGDTFSISTDGVSYNSLVEVLNDDTVVWDKPRRRQHWCVKLWGVGNTLSGSCNAQTTFEVVDGVGATNSFFLYPGAEVWYNSGFEPAGYWKLLCYHQNNTTIYTNPAESTCNLDTVLLINGVRELKQGEDYRVQLFSGAITVQRMGEFTSGVSFLLYNLSGQLMLQERLGRALNFINVADLPEGLYVYRIATGNGNSLTGKLIKR